MEKMANAQETILIRTQKHTHNPKSNQPHQPNHSQGCPAILKYQ